MLLLSLTQKQYKSKKNRSEEALADLKERIILIMDKMEEKIPNFRNPEKYISQRIENEIKESDQKYRLFVR